MDLTSLRAVLSEWRGLVLPSRFEKAQQGGSHSLQLGLRHMNSHIKPLIFDDAKVLR